MSCVTIICQAWKTAAKNQRPTAITTGTTFACALLEDGQYTGGGFLCCKAAQTAGFPTHERDLNVHKYIHAWRAAAYACVGWVRPALLRTGRVLCWGNNNRGQLGRGRTYEHDPTEDCMCGRKVGCGKNDATLKARGGPGANPLRSRRCGFLMWVAGTRQMTQQCLGAAV